MVERIVPGTDPWDWMFPSHIARYQFALAWTRNKVVMDAACGSGYGSHLLARSAARVIALDSSSEALELARAHFSAPNVSHHCADLTRPLTEFYNTCDVVVSFETLEHLERPEAFIKETSRVLRPQGLLLLSVPAEAGAADNPFHKHIFTPDSLRQLLCVHFPQLKFYCQVRDFPLWLSLVRRGLHRWQQSPSYTAVSAPLTRRWKDPRHSSWYRLRRGLKQILIEQPHHWQFQPGLTARAQCWVCLCRRSA
ncbi:MAG: class I SAM-dependent methyltransferase [Acidobacteriota bacterium]